MTWVLFLRYHLMSRQIRKENLLSSLPETKPKQNGSNQTEPVPWLVLFKSPALWYVRSCHVFLLVLFFRAGLQYELSNILCDTHSNFLFSPKKGCSGSALWPHVGFQRVGKLVTNVLP